jgi:hypothetical protein
LSFLTGAALLLLLRLISQRRSLLRLQRLERHRAHRIAVDSKLWDHQDLLPADREHQRGAGRGLGNVANGVEADAGQHHAASGLEFRSATAVVVRGDPASDGGVVGAPNYRGIPWDGAPTYIVRDSDRAFGSVFTRRIQAMGIRDRPTSFRSPWQNGHVERLIGSIRREWTDHLIVLNEEHLRRILAKFSTYYNGWRPHVSLGKDAPNRRPIERFGDIVAHAILGGLHDRYARI